MDHSLFSPCPRSGFAPPISSSPTPADFYSNKNKQKASEVAASSTPNISCCHFSVGDDLLEKIDADYYSNKNKRKASEVAASSTPKISCCQFSVVDLLEKIDAGYYGDVSKEINDLYKRRMACLSKPVSSFIVDNGQDKTSKQSRILGDNSDELDKASADGSDEANTKKDNNIHVHVDDNLVEKNKEPSLVPETCIQKKGNYIGVEDDLATENKEQSFPPETCIERKGTYIGVEDDFTDEDDEQSENNDALFQEMAFALESCKDTSVNASTDEHITDDEEDCDHSYILKDDIGYVCRICGLIQKKIDSIIEYKYAKKTSDRTYKYEKHYIRDEEANDILPGEMRSSSGHDFVETELNAHPRHSRSMKPHQVEGFNFLARNLVNDNPGGCILAHAPGSGKTFTIISFIQSFMAKYPSERPLVVLPKGILQIWKKEFLLRQVDVIPLLDFYSVNGRSQQLKVLKQWASTRSILFLGYSQFSSIVSDTSLDENTSACRKILLKQTSILIMDEGHTPRNNETNQWVSLERVETPRKVVLSGTLYQNHISEVFNILNLVRPGFLKLESCKDSKRRILSIIETTKKGNLLKKSDREFYEMVEESLLQDGNLDRKAHIIQGLRDMTSKVLHYYKGDSLDELPGLVDFTLFLNLSPQQKREVVEVKKAGGRFKISSDGSSIYVHPILKSLIQCATRKDRLDEVKIDELLKNLDINAGVKAKFYLNLLRLCESMGEKLLVFSQYILPMKFLERLTVKVKGWSVGKEIFMITGDLENDVRELHMESFNNSMDSRVLFGSIKACSEGISFVGASRIIVLDVHLNPSVTRQAIGRAFRPGQVKKVYTYRLVAAGSPEQEDHSTCFKKESIPKLWFEWNGICHPEDFQLEELHVTDCGDNFLETPSLHEDVLSLYRR